MTLVLIEMVCAAYLIRIDTFQSDNNRMLCCSYYDKDSVHHDLIAIFKKISREVIDRYGIVLTFSFSRIQWRLLESVPTLGLIPPEEEEVNMIVQKLGKDRERMPNESIEDLHDALEWYISQVGQIRAIMVVQKFKDTHTVNLPIPPQYAIAFNENKFTSWISKSCAVVD